ncbi:1179_t:CDS:2 [Funneliformis mosseae]|uniref:1179_t:CDS:1 n=1 Tax=Funneliformis mosseae TaxID=27381 RepID=A0A9N9BC21_FUNMO|nr:1179_t:CDS:2 [Funneliformis mosseae]
MHFEKRINYIEEYKYHEKEFDDISFQHNILSYIWQGDYSSRIQERLIKGNTKVIDLGCGTGQWLIDMSLKYPLSTFIGIDISSRLFPSQEDKPNNVAFLQYDLLEHPGIPFPNETFDFVYLRCLSMTFKENDWAHVINEIVRVTDINGCVEFMDFLCEGGFKGPIMEKLCSSLISFLESKNIKPPSTTKLTEYLNQTNQISNLHLEVKSSPLGSWGGKLGELMLSDYITIFQRFKSILVSFMKLSEKEYDKLLSELENECVKYQLCCYTYRLYGNKTV